MTRWPGKSGYLLIIMLTWLSVFSFQTVSAQVPVTILFTHDLHDNLLPFKLEQNGVIRDYGGYARLQTAINQQRAQDPQLILVDGGDFSMGTLFQTIFPKEASSLRLLGQMGYDAVTLGNHEFDFRPDGLAESLLAAQASREHLPSMVQGNIRFPPASGENTQALGKLKKAMAASGVKEYTVLERKGYRIGIFGIMGHDAASNAPMAGIEFTDSIEQARKIVDQLKNKEKVDLIVCLSHSGTEKDLDKAEDVVLARKVPGIDVIVSGHSHTKLAKPITVGDTVICSAGEYGQNLGMLTLNRNSSGNWTKLQYRLIPINSNLTGDAALNRRIEQFKSIVQESYLDSLGLTFDGKLAHSAFDFPTLAQMYDQHAEQTLGNLVSDAYIYAVQQAEGANYEPVAAAIVPNGTIRASLVRGDITVSDAFNVSSLGIGPDKRSGYPLISIYLTGQELKTACEVDASIAPIMKTAQLYMSGMTYTFNPKRLLFNKITHVALQNPDGSIQEIEDDRLYRVAAGLYSAQMLSVVGDKSFGLLSIVPKTREGLPIRDFEAQIIRDTKNGGEIKEWMALAQYLQSFVQVNGVAQIPAYYDKKQGRKIIDDRAALSAILTQPNKLALAFYGLIMLILILITLALRRVLKRRPQIAKQTPPL